MSGFTPINYYSASGTYNLQPCHAGQGRIIGEDGKRYAVIQVLQHPSDSHYPVLYCYDTNTTVFYGASEGYSQALTKIQADITTLALPSSPASSDFTDIAETFAVADTKYFVVVGNSPRSGGYQLAFVRYKINAAGAIELVDGFITRCSASFSGRYHAINLVGALNQSAIVDCRIIGSTLYIAGSGQSLTSNIHDTIMLAFPLTTFGTCSNTVGSYDAFVRVLNHGPMFLWPFAPGYINGQRGCIVSISGNVGLLAYAGVGSIQNSSWGNPFFSGGVEYNSNPRLIFAYNNSGFADYGATFGIPFPDVFYDYSGALTTNINNDWNGPSFTSHGGKDYMIFTRAYDGQAQVVRFKIFTWPAGILLQDVTTDYFDLGYFPSEPVDFAPANMFFSPDDSGHLILQSDELHNTGVWRLYSDFGVLGSKTTRTRIWGNILVPQ